MFATRTWYLIAGVILAAGAIAAIVVQDWTALVVFAAFSAFMFLLASKIEHWERSRTRRPD